MSKRGLKQNSSNIQPQGFDYTTVCDPVINDNLPLLRQLVENQGRAVNERNLGGSTPLMCAARSGRVPLIEYLVERGADIEARDICGVTPLTFAATAGHLAAVECLVTFGANLESRDRTGITALAYAARMLKPTVVAYLCAQGADVTVKGPGGLAPIHHVGFNTVGASNTALDTIAILLRYGADLSSTIDTGESALQLLAERFTQSNAAQLMKEIAEAQLDVAISAGDLTEVRRVVECKTINMHTSERDFLLHAARTGDLSLFEYLVERGATICGDPASDSFMSTMLQRRDEWTAQAKSLAHRWRLPMTAIRIIHTYLIGFNWETVYQSLQYQNREPEG